MVNNINRQLFLSFLIILSLALTSFDVIAKVANITVTASRNPVMLDESFQITYSVQGGFFSSAVDDDPDFSPLDKDFDILNSSQSLNSSYVNGTWKQVKSWTLNIIAKDIGKFTIPPVSFGKDISPAIQITVKNSSSPNSESPNGQATIPAKIFLETAIDKKSGWIQSQFIYTVRLMRTVGIANASLSEPVSSDPDAIIEKLTEDNYQKTRNGITYDVFERRYAIFPQKSGQLKIKPLTFEGRVNATQPRTIFDQFRMSGQLKRLRSKAVDFTVKAAPKNITLQDWLPSSNVQLIEQWSDEIQNIKAGEPITRTIIISADELTSVQLPELKFEDIKGVKQYPDKAITEDRKDDNGIIGLKQVKVALIPGKAGSYTLPEVKLQWWNTKTDKKETAILPEQVIEVAANPANSIAAVPVTPPAQTAVTPQPDSSAFDSTRTASVPEQEQYWKWLSAFFALAWLLTLMLYIRKPSDNSTGKQHENKINKKVISQRLKAATRSVEKNAKDNNAANTKNALIEWAKQFYADNSISNLSLITSFCSSPLAIEIEKLNQSLYSPENPEWDNKSLLHAFNDELSSHAKQKNNKSSALKPLYIP